MLSSLTRPRRRFRSFCRFCVTIVALVSSFSLAAASLAARLAFLPALSSFGYCEPARTVEVWDETGVHRLPWEQAASVAALVDRGALVLSSDAEWITVIQPWGKRKRVGVAAWNAGRSRLVAGARVVAPSHLKGTTPTWLNKALPDFLAHVVAGRECRTFTPPGA